MTDKDMPIIDTKEQNTAAVPESDGSKHETQEAQQESAPQAAVPENMSPEMQELTDDIVGAMKSVYDPEIPVDIYELGLIYRVEVTDSRDVIIDMTLTAPGCPVAEHMPVWVKDAVSALDGIGDVTVNMVFDPPWDPSRMSDEARVALDMF
jgi:FeS assembly SUF system protein